MSTETASKFAETAKRWLDAQPGPSLRIAREITKRRKELAPRVLREGESVTGRAWENGTIHGLRVALSYLGDRPGDISDTGAEGFITQVESADEMAAEPFPVPSSTEGAKR